MNIYFHIDELSRDAVVASALKNLFREKGHRLIYGNRVVNRLLSRFHNYFDIVIVPRPHFLYDNWGDEWMSWKAKIVMLSAESLGIICKDHKVMARALLENRYFEGDKEYINRIDAFCLWGKKQLRAIKENAPEVADKCHVVGHPRHDKECLPEGRKRESLSRNGRRKIGVITRAVMLNDYFGRSALECFSTLFDEHFQYEYVNRKTGERLRSRRPGAQPTENLIVQAIDIESTLSVISALIKAGHIVTLRVHPKERIEEWKKLLARCRLGVSYCDPLIPVARWLEELDYVVGPPSTCFYDAVMLGKIPICISELDKRRMANIGELWEDNNRLMAHVFKPGSLKEMLEYIDSDKSKVAKELLYILEDEADFPECSKSLSRVVDVCLGLVGKPYSRPRPLFLYQLAQAIFTNLWRLKNRLVRRRENSAMFALGKKEVEFIDSLAFRRNL